MLSSDSEDDKSSVSRLQSLSRSQSKANVRLKRPTVLSDNDEEDSSPRPRMSRMSLRARDSDAEQSLKDMMDIDDGMQVHFRTLYYSLKSYHR